MDLIRVLLLKLEALPYLSGEIVSLYAGREPMFVEGFSTDEIEYHLRLIVESGFLISHGENTDGEIYFSRLSVAGHDFVDSIRSPEVWVKTKKGAEAAGGFTIDLLKDLAKGFIKKQVEELTGMKL